MEGADVPNDKIDLDALATLAPNLERLRVEGGMLVWPAGGEYRFDALRTLDLMVTLPESGRLDLAYLPRLEELYIHTNNLGVSLLNAYGHSHLRTVQLTVHGYDNPPCPP